ncbi:MAG: enolase C-terminal domain-like protein [Chloroflexota bacterium]|nr:mandelate racemase [Chloroflexota bacterium]
MKDKPKITRLEIHRFDYQLKDLALLPGHTIFAYEPGATMTLKAHALKIITDEGVTGEYVGSWAATDWMAIPEYGHILIGRNALDREGIYNDLKLELRQRARLGLSQLDIALWDLAGKFYGAPIYELLGGNRINLPCYASTHTADNHQGGLNSPEAFADFAEQCLEMGYPGFKIHPWADAPMAQHVATIHAVGKRVGGKMDLMLDPYCALKTFGDALKAGWACDEEKFFWWEDPFRDGGISAFAHRKLRQLVKTPLLQLEHVRGLEQHVDFIVADGTDFVRGDPDIDGGITGVMKIAHAAEGFGLDVEMHAPAGPERRHLMAAIHNMNYYEMALVHPKAPFAPQAPVFKGDYKDGLDAIDKNGCVQVPQGPGLGVEYDWDYITKHSQGVKVID